MKAIVNALKCMIGRHGSKSVIPGLGWVCLNCGKWRREQ